MGSSYFLFPWQSPSPLANSSKCPSCLAAAAEPDNFSIILRLNSIEFESPPQNDGKKTLIRHFETEFCEVVSLVMTPKRDLEMVTA